MVLVKTNFSKFVVDALMCTHLFLDRNSSFLSGMLLSDWLRYSLFILLQIVSNIALERALNFNKMAAASLRC